MGSQYHLADQKENGLKERQVFVALSEQSKFFFFLVAVFDP